MTLTAPGARGGVTVDSGGAITVDGLRVTVQGAQVAVSAQATLDLSCSGLVNVKGVLINLN